MGGEDVHAEAAAVADLGPGRRALRRAEQDQRRLERDGGDGVGRHRERTVLAVGRHDRDASREVPEHLAVARGVERLLAAHAALTRGAFVGSVRSGRCHTQLSRTGATRKDRCRARKQPSTLASVQGRRQAAPWARCGPRGARSGSPRAAGDGGQGHEADTTATPRAHVRRPRPRVAQQPRRDRHARPRLDAILPNWASELVRPASAAPGPDAVLPRDDAVVPYLATNWTAPAQRRLRVRAAPRARGVTGDALTAADVQWSLERAIAASPLAPFLFALAHIDSADPITILGPHRVRINVTRAEPVHAVGAFEPRPRDLRQPASTSPTPVPATRGRSAGAQPLGQLRRLLRRPVPPRRRDRAGHKPRLLAAIRITRAF